MLLARNRMVTRVLAKTTKVKKNFMKGKKKFKRILSCLFGGRRKVPSYEVGCIWQNNNKIIGAKFR